MSPNVLPQSSAELFTIVGPEAVTPLRTEIVAGMRVEHVRVIDGFETDNPEKRREVQAEIEHWDQELQQHPEWQAPTKDKQTELFTIDPANEASAWYYSTKAQQAWGSMMPTALALYPLQYPESTMLPNGVPTDERLRNLFKHGLDAVGIRTRATIMSNLALRLAERQEKDDLQWVSIACGAAVPVLSAVEQIKEKYPSKKPHLELVDIDPKALSFAKTLADTRGLQEGDDFTVRESDIVADLLLGNKLTEALGKDKAAMVDGLGIFEYFPDGTAVRALQKMYQLVAPGGNLVVGNMLDDRPQLTLNQRGIGWPKIYPRSLADLAQLVEKAGIARDSVTTYVPEDGIYAVLSIEKPVQSRVGTMHNLGHLAALSNAS